MAGVAVRICNLSRASFSTRSGVAWARFQGFKVGLFSAGEILRAAQGLRALARIRLRMGRKRGEDGGRQHRAL